MEPALSDGSTESLQDSTQLSTHSNNEDSHLYSSSEELQHSTSQEYDDGSQHSQPDSTEDLHDDSIQQSQSSTSDEQSIDDRSEESHQSSSEEVPSHLTLHSSIFLVCSGALTLSSFHFTLIHSSSLHHPSSMFVQVPLSHSQTLPSLTSSQTLTPSSSLSPSTPPNTAHLMHVLSLPVQDVLLWMEVPPSLHRVI